MKRIVIITVVLAFTIWLCWPVKRIIPHVETNYNPHEGCTAYRGPIYTKTVVNEFKVGDTLTSKENGAWMLWDDSMPRDWIVGYISDTGFISIR